MNIYSYKAASQEDSPGIFHCTASGTAPPARPLRPTPTVAVHDAQHNRRCQSHDEGHGKVVDDHLHMFLPVVMHKDHGSVLAGVITGELGVFFAVRRGEVLTVNVGGIPATFNVH